MARPGPRVLQALDAGLYAGALTALVALAGLAVGAVRGNGLVGAEYLLFWAAFLAMAAGAWKLRPKAAWKEESRVAADPKADTPLARAVRRVPPLSRYDLERRERATDGAKLLLASALMLAVHVGLGLR